MNKYQKSLNFIRNTLMVDFDILDDVSKKVPINAKQIEVYENLSELVKEHEKYEKLQHALNKACVRLANITYSKTHDEMDALAMVDDMYDIEEWKAWAMKEDTNDGIK